MRTTLHALLVGASLIGVHATKADIGWRAVVNVPQVSFQVDTVDGQQQVLFITAPVEFTRLGSADNVITLVASVVPAGNPLNNTEALDPDGDEQAVPPVIVHRETFQVAPNAVTFSRSAYIDIPVPESWVDQAIYISIDSETSSVTETGGFIITLDQAQNIIVFKSPSQWVGDATAGLTAELNAEKVEYDEQEPADLGEDADFPDEDENTSPIVVNIPDKDGRLPTQPTPSDGVTVIRTTKTTTICPTPTAPPPPCTTDTDNGKGEGKGKGNGGKHHVRQLAPLQPAYVNARITFTGWKGTKQALRLVKVAAFGNVYDSEGTYLRRIGAVQTLDVNGRGKYKFNLRQGQRIVVDRVQTTLEGSYYRIGTRNTETQALTTAIKAMRLTVNPWRVSAGETKSYSNSYSGVVANDGIIVADAFQRIADFARTKVVNKKYLEKIDVWFPSTNPGTFFRGGSGPFLNIPADDAKDPDVLAHEYGHWFHFLARKKATFRGGGDHGSCSSPNSTTALSEGYATAFGLLAVDGTVLAGPIYGQYLDVMPPPRADIVRQYEDFACVGSRTLEAVEGRVTAALFDLGDRRLDVVNATSSEFSQIVAGFRRSDIDALFRPHDILWRAMRGNPTNAREYWYAFQGFFGGDAEQKAWNIFQYNWALFPRNRV